MKQIWKFELPRQENFKIEMPQGALITSFQLQNDCPVMWAIVDIQAPLVRRGFTLTITGSDLPEANLIPLGTIQVGTTVWHLLEIV